MKLTLQIEFDPEDTKNAYNFIIGGPTNFGRVLLSNGIHLGTSVSLEFGTGDVITGTLTKLVELEI